MKRPITARTTSRAVIERNALASGGPLFPPVETMEAALDLELLFPVHTSRLCKKSSTDKSKVEREAKRRDTFFLSFSPSKGLTLHIMESLGVPHAPIWERVHQRCLEGDWDLSLKSTPQGLRSIIAANSHALLLLLCRLHYTTVRERLHPRRQPGRSCGRRPDASGRLQQSH